MEKGKEPVARTLSKAHVVYVFLLQVEVFMFKVACVIRPTAGVPPQLGCISEIHLKVASGFVPGCGESLFPAGYLLVPLTANFVWMQVLKHIEERGM